MRYGEAIAICNHINDDRIGDREIDTEAKLSAVEKILSMTTINAVKKDTLLNVIRWFWDNCVEAEEGET